MTKKIFFVTVVLLFAFSFNAFASERTIAETRWNNFLETADLQYPAHDGQFTLGYTMRSCLISSNPSQEGTVLDSNLTSSGVYSLTDKIELTTSGLYGFSKLPSMLTTTQSDLGLKVQFMKNKLFTFAVSGSVLFNHSEEEGNESSSIDPNVTLFTNTNISKGIKLYNNFGLTHYGIDKFVEFNEKQMTNAIEFKFNEKNTLRLAHNMYYINIDDASHDYSGIYRGRFTDKLTYMLTLRNTPEFAGLRYTYVGNLFEYRPNTTDIYTAQFHVYSDYYLNFLQLDASKKIGNFKFSGGMNYYLPEGVTLPRVQLSGATKYYFTKHMALELGGNCRTTFRGFTPTYSTLTLKTAFVWE